MEITVNGQKINVDSEIGLVDFLQQRGISEISVVERNGEIISKGKRHLVTLRDGDVLEIVKLVGGG